MSPEDRPLLEVEVSPASLEQNSDFQILRTGSAMTLNTGTGRSDREVCEIMVTPAA